MWQHWETPRPFIEIKDDNHLVINKEVAFLISCIETPIVAVSINGVYRTGKSYLMNRLAGMKTGFPLGSSIQSVTKGIWVWPVPHPYDFNKTLLLMDTEGLKDASKGDDTYDMWISCLSVLLSSLYIYNATGHIDNNMVDTLNFVSEMSQHVRMKIASEAGDDMNMDEYFPAFVLAVRDFCLEPKVHNKEVSADEYMEFMLLTAKSNAVSERELKRNKVKQSIRRYFPRRKCFFFSLPVVDSLLLRDLETLEEDKLSHLFKQQSDEFCEYVYRNATIKMIDSSNIVNGRVFSELAEAYVQVIQCPGMVPCIESAVSMVARMENDRALETSASVYIARMNALDFPLGTIEVAAAHQKYYQEAVGIFLDNAFLDEGNAYHNLLQNKLNMEYEKFIRFNNTTSAKKCAELLNELSKNIRTKFRAGTYICPGGYKKIKVDLEDVKRAYAVVPCKGVQAEKQLQEFISHWNFKLEAVMASDNALTAAQKQHEAQHLATEEMSLKMKQQEQELRQWHKHQENVVAAHEKHLARLHQAFKDRVDEQQKAFNVVLEHRTSEQERLLKEGFKHECVKLQKSIDELNARKTATYWNLAAICAGIGSTVCSMLPHPAFKVAGGVLGVIAAAIKSKSE